METPAIAAIPADALAHARRLHEQAFTFDYMPGGWPMVMTDRHRRVMLGELERNAPVGQVMRSMLNDRLNEAMQQQVRGQLTAILREAGIKGMQITLGGIEVDPSGWDAIVRDVAWYTHAERVCGLLRICRTPAELERAAADGILGVVLGTQDSAWCDTGFQRLETLYQAGLRVLQLTYNRRNLFGDGCSEPSDGGLSRQGIALVDKANAMGVIVDVSHCGHRTTTDALRKSTRPVAVTHAAYRALNPHPRTKSDDVLHALRDCDGYIGIVALPAFLRADGNATISDIIRHIEYAAGIVGIDRVGIATDWGGITPDVPDELMEATKRAFIHAGTKPEELPEFGRMPAEFGQWTRWPNITAELLRRGHGDAEVRGLIGGNWLAFMRRALP